METHRNMIEGDGCSFEEIDSELNFMRKYKFINGERKRKVFFDRGMRKLFWRI